MKLLGGFDRL